MNNVDRNDLLSRVKEIEELLHFPGVAGHADRAKALAISIARSGQVGGIADFAMQLVSAVDQFTHNGGDDGEINESLRRLRLALQEAKTDCASHRPNAA